MWGYTCKTCCIIWGYECKTCLGVTWENMDRANGQIWGKICSSTFVSTAFISFGLFNIFSYFHLQTNDTFMTCGWNNVGAELGKSGGSHKSQAQSSSMVEGHQQFTLHTTRFDITQPILLALLRRVKLNNMGFLFFFCTNGKQSIAKQKRYER